MYMMKGFINRYEKWIINIKKEVMIMKKFKLNIESSGFSFVEMTLIAVILATLLLKVFGIFSF